jgi:hypothetical protein
VLDAPERDRLGAAVLERGALEDTIGRSSIDCSREQIGQFCRRRLWRQKVGTDIIMEDPTSTQN